MNWFWKSNKLGTMNPIELRNKLGLSKAEFDTLMSLEVQRYKKYIEYNYGKDYWISKIKENPNVGLYGLTPTFDPHPSCTPSYIFNDESGVFLEKTWSTAHKNNKGKNLPFDFKYSN